MHETDVVCIGVMLMDLPLGPLGDDLFEKETVMIDEIHLTTGGDALNEAVILSRLGNRVALIGHIGRDLPGDMIVKRCEEEKIDYSNVNRDPQVSTRINVVLIREDGQRFFIKSKNGSSRSLRVEEINFEPIKNAKAVSLASLFCSKLRDGKLMEAVLKTAKDAGTVTFADMVPMQAGDSFRDIGDSLSLLDYFLPNLEEAQQLTGEQEPDRIADWLLDHGVKHVVIKMGKSGCFVKNQEKKFSLPAFPAAVIDTTGAGDNFVAGFITAVLEGRSLEECARFANAAAAVSTESIGAVTGVLNRKQIEEYQRRYQG